MIELDWKPSPKKLREFGLFALVGFGAFGCLLAWRLKAFSGSGAWFWPMVIWSLAVICPILGLTAPRFLRPLFIALTLVAFPIGWVLGMVVMGILYFGIFTPIAFLFRKTGRDALLLRDSTAESASFWINAPETPPSAASYYRQS